MKPVRFIGASREAISAFPRNARRKIGFELEKLQEGKDPTDWKPMPAVGQGVREIRVRDEAGAFRVIYVATFQAAVYVLHGFQKKTQRTPKLDIELAKMRLKELPKD